MILVGQDKTTAFNFDNVYDVMLDGCKIRATVGYHDGAPLEPVVGEYASQTRAEEVFNDLINAIGEASVKPIGVVYLGED